MWRVATSHFCPTHAGPKRKPSAVLVPGVTHHPTTKRSTPCTTKLPSTTLVESLFQHKLVVASMCWLWTMCWLWHPPRLQCCARVDLLATGCRWSTVAIPCPSTTWFQSSACAPCLPGHRANRGGPCICRLWHAFAGLAPWPRRLLAAWRGPPLATHGQQSTGVPWLVQCRCAHATALCAPLAARPPGGQWVAAGRQSVSTSGKRKGVPCLDRFAS